MTLIKVSNTASHDISVTFEFSVSPSLTLFGCVTALKSLLTWVSIPVKTIGYLGRLGLCAV